MNKLLIILLSVVVVLIIGIVLFEGYLFLVSQHGHGGPAPSIIIEIKREYPRFNSDF